MSVLDKVGNAFLVILFFINIVLLFRRRAVLTKEQEGMTWMEVVQSKARMPYSDEFIEKLAYNTTLTAVLISAVQVLIMAFYASRSYVGFPLKVIGAAATLFSIYMLIEDWLKFLHLEKKLYTKDRNEPIPLWLLRKAGSLVIVGFTFAILRYVNK
jgi:uncharacterized membrane protein YcjF (UPF0283 family)